MHGLVLFAAGAHAELGPHIRPLAGLQSTYGTFFVTGNHEYYSGAHSWIDALRQLGICVLMNEHVVIQHRKDSQDPEPAIVVVAGVADFSNPLLRACTGYWGPPKRFGAPSEVTFLRLVRA